MTVQSRLDAGAFTAAEIQTMARFVGISVDQVRRLTECSVLIGKLARRQEEPVSADAALREALQGDPRFDVGTIAASLLARGYVIRRIAPTTVIERNEP